MAICPSLVGGRPHLAVLAALVLVFVATAAVGQTLPGETPERPAKFAGWLARAEAGDVEAQCMVGVAYLNGQEVAQDFTRGLGWVTRASDAGYAYARFVLADVFSRGYAGVSVNDEKSYYYATLAAASTVLPEKYRDRAVKIRDAVAKRLTPAQLTRVQAMTAQAPRDAVAGS